MVPFTARVLDGGEGFDALFLALLEILALLPVAAVAFLLLPLELGNMVG